MSGVQSFPPDFLWGTATSAYQIEGAVNDDGRGQSIWDTFAHTPGKIKNGDTADIANDHYHRFRDDVRLMKSLGAKAYRFSISWPRIFPSGVGRPNPVGLDFYNQLVDELLAAGIEPFATLYHWDLPQSLQDRFGGWESADTAKAFGDYAGYAAAKLSDRVKHFFTINEFASFVDMGYGDGRLAPGLQLPRKRLNQVRHHAVLGHGLAVQAIRARGLAGTKCGPADNLTIAVPIIETEANIRAAEIATRELNAAYLTVILEGRYTPNYLEEQGSDAPDFDDESLSIISSPIDFVGINVYRPNHYIRASTSPPGYQLLSFSPSHPRMQSSWLMFGPESLYWGPKLTQRLWNVGEIHITENGCGTDDVVNSDDCICDTDRIMFLRNYLTQLLRATAEGVPVKSYFQWSLMDNFEWIDGYATRFGLFHVDFATQRRTPKLSADYFREVACRNAVL